MSCIINVLGFYVEGARNPPPWQPTVTLASTTVPSTVTAYNGTHMITNAYMYTLKTNGQKP